jgi:hypothetical protein
MKPDNLLVFRCMDVKIGDLGMSVKMDCRIKDDNQEVYRAKGYTPGFIPKAIKHKFENPDKFLLSKTEMIKADIFALLLTFQHSISKLGDLLDPNSD